MLVTDSFSATRNSTKAHAHAHHHTMTFSWPPAHVPENVLFHSTVVASRTFKLNQRKIKKNFLLILTEAWTVQQNFLGNPPSLLITIVVAHIIRGLIFNKYRKASKVQVWKIITTHLSHLVWNLCFNDLTVLMAYV